MRHERGERPSLRRALQCAAIAVAPVFCTPVASACPICQSETGKQVRAGIFDENFAFNLFGSLLPFPIFLGIVAAIHGLPARGTAGPTAGPKPTPDADESLTGA